MTIQFWAFIYRLTGWYSPFAELAEYRHVMEVIKKLDWGIDDAFVENSAYNRIGIEIGAWQANHGFYRRFK